MTGAGFAGAAATTCTLVGYAPQILHLLRQRSVAGLAVSTFACHAVLLAGWAVRGVQITDWALIVACGGPALLAGAICALGIRGGIPARDLRSVAVLAAVLLLAAVTVGFTAAGAVLAAGSLAASAPQAHKAWTAPTIAGIAAGTWAFGAAEGTLWTTYAMLSDQPSLIVASAAQLIGAATILAALAVRRDAVSRTA